MKRLFAVAAAIAVGVTGTLLVAAPAHAARKFPTKCTTSVSVEINSYNEVQGYLWAKVPAASGGGDCSLEAGDSGAAVKVLQTSLNRCYGRSLTVDGSFGSNTLAALKYAQSAESLSPDGWYLKSYEGLLLKWAAQDYKGYWHCGRAL